MISEYRIGKGWKIFMYVATVGFWALLYFMIATQWDDSRTSVEGKFLISGMILIMDLVFTFGCYDMTIAKLQIFKDKVVKINSFGTKEIYFKEIESIEEIKGYVILHRKKGKKFKVSEYFQGKSSWVNYIYQNLSEDAKWVDEETITDEVEMHSDIAYGRTEEEREISIKNTKKLTRTINTIAVLLMLVFYFKPGAYYDYLLIGLSVLPILATLIVVGSKGKIKLFKKDKSAYPQLGTSIGFPPMVLMLRVILDFNVLDYLEGLKYVLILTPFLTLIILSLSKGSFADTKADKILAPILVFFGCAIYLGSILFSFNCRFDNSEPVSFQTEILKKKISSSRKSPDRYIFKAAPWGKLKEAEDIQVTKKKYDSKQVGDPITVYQFKGLFDVPWIYAQ